MDEEFEETPPASEEDFCLPKATVAKIIQKIVPSDVICPKETRGLITDCCIEFIHLISSEANEICKNEAKKTITGDHVIAALETLGFEEYIKDTVSIYQEHQDVMKKKETRHTLRYNSGATEEELEREQKLLFYQARQRYNSTFNDQVSPNEDDDECYKEEYNYKI